MDCISSQQSFTYGYNGDRFYNYLKDNYNGFDIDDSGVNKNTFNVYADKNGDIKMFSYKEDVKISEYKWVRHTYFYTPDGELYKDVPENMDWASSVNTVNAYLGLPERK